ncbi:MAG: hypothetical protein CTY15_09165 [Methylocystis sp.]|nr:MAG: hypothetical protein CTY15_09165 [Methylocystis sp.]
MSKLAIADDVLEEIAALAKERGVTSEHLAQEMLRDSLLARKSPENLRALLETIAAMTPSGIPQTDSVELLREDRER